MDERERVARLCASVGWDVTASAVRLNDRAALTPAMQIARARGGYSESQFAVIDAVESLLAQEPAAVEPHRDPEHPHNSAKHHTGQMCVEKCGRPAGTAWSPYWCQPCNAERIDRIGRRLAALAQEPA